MEKYTENYTSSIKEKELFWKEQSQHIAWFKEPGKILTQNEKGFYRWFADGELNTCYLCLDVHVKNGFGNQVAVYYDSPALNSKRAYTYAELLSLVEKFAGALSSKGVQKGDRVIIYMPMVIETIIAMLACARLGAIHSVVFGGFAPQELATRIDDAQPKIIITASHGIEFEKIISYKPLLDKALELATFQPSATILLQREKLQCELNNKNEFDFYTLLQNAKPHPCVSVKGSDPLYILYTSGTTGKPKGVVRDNGGHAVALRYSMEYIYDTKPEEIFWAASDVGWVVGHSYIVYAPLIQRCTTILYEGKPIKTPDAGAFWRIISEYQVNTFFTAPTAIRAIKKEDNEGVFFKQYNLSCLKRLFLAGERCDPPTFDWIKTLLQKPVIDHWWQTESGWPMLGITTKIDTSTAKRGSAGKPIAGYDVVILSEEGKKLNANEEGLVAIQLPLAPGCLLTLWNNDEGFQQSYLDQLKGYYLTGDGGLKDDENYFFIMGRIDDVINVSGHRLSTGQMEEIVASHTGVAECAVVGIADKLKGQVPIGFIVLKNSFKGNTNLIEGELANLVREKIGAIACFKNVLIVNRLPKTRSGKILRKIMRHIADGTTFQTPATIDDPLILEEIKTELSNAKIGLAFE